MNNKMLALYGLKWNPFAPNVPTEALHVTPRLESFCWRVQQLAGSFTVKNVATVRAACSMGGRIGDDGG